MVECVKVYSRKNIPWKIRQCIKFEYNGKYNSEESNYICPYENLNSLLYFCRKNHLDYKIENNFSTRSTTYRKTFFENNKPVIGNIYFCSYCGRPVNGKNLTIDHLYPVDKVQKNIYLQKKLKRKGLKTINDSKNLVPSCFYCNRKKSAKMGLWILRGEIGRNQKLWFLRHAVRICVLVLLFQQLRPYIGILLIRFGQLL